MNLEDGKKYKFFFLTEKIKYFLPFTINLILISVPSKESYLIWVPLIYNAMTYYIII